ncbi:AlpA family phage regulatory protein [Curtobacterium flaccumfaciens]|jgi:predicted DNA-binding transcriptional regulator AlpA|uniref:AlpA family phage regulatory protein n=1 Tax=Curtobacterium poinsettiae TaxID=159612 RepID=A0A9Q9T3G3_9MICO|nr:AlpA family phage regulatory protein [Curtobacterium flaccumfaciens]UXN25821.1 AlpA family phage regulatory protein [Curtobacterium flaccumfaciens]UYC80659.1 AlpA family phage regulatory protein [Curtobacterium flaccumfaciens pv. poinsettiae]
MSSGDTLSTRESLLTSEQVGNWVGLTASALSQMRFKGTGPKYRKLGPKTVRYSPADVQEWLDESARTGTAGEAA